MFWPVSSLSHHQPSSSFKHQPSRSNVSNLAWPLRKPIEWRTGIKFICRFCGGKSCKHENWRKNKRNPPELEGLNCDWITPNLLATQRPSSRLIKQYDLLEKFKVLLDFISRRITFCRYFVSKSLESIPTAEMESIRVAVWAICLKSSTKQESNSTTTAGKIIKLPSLRSCWKFWSLLNIVFKKEKEQLFTATQEEEGQLWSFVATWSTARRYQLKKP